MIGNHVLSVKVHTRKSDVLRTIAANCNNLSSVKLGGCYTEPLPFQNLKELKVGYNVRLSTDDWSNCFVKKIQELKTLNTVTRVAIIAYDYYKFTGTEDLENR